MIARVRRAWQRIVAAPGASGPIVVVSHVGALRAWLIGCAGFDDAQAMNWPLPPLGGIQGRLSSGDAGARSAIAPFTSMAEAAM